MTDPTDHAHIYSTDVSLLRADCPRLASAFPAAPAGVALAAAALMALRRAYFSRSRLAVRVDRAALDAAWAEFLGTGGAGVEWALMQLGQQVG